MPQRLVEHDWRQLRWRMLLEQRHRQQLDCAANATQRGSLARPLRRLRHQSVCTRATDRFATTLPYTMHQTDDVRVRTVRFPKPTPTPTTTSNSRSRSRARAPPRSPSKETLLARRPTPTPTPTTSTNQRTRQGTSKEASYRQAAPSRRAASALCRGLGAHTPTSAASLTRALSLSLSRPLNVSSNSCVSLLKFDSNATVQRWFGHPFTSVAAATRLMELQEGFAVHCSSLARSLSYKLEHGGKPRSPACYHAPVAVSSMEASSITLAR